MLYLLSVKLVELSTIAKDNIGSPRVLEAIVLVYSFFWGGGVGEM